MHGIERHSRPAVILTTAAVIGLGVGLGGCGRKSVPPVPPDLPYRMPSEQEATRASEGAPEALPAPPPTAPAGERGVAAGELPVPDSLAAATGTAEPDLAGTRPGYRVQLFATTDAALAETQAQEMRQIFEEEVYVELEGLLYKVRVGDCVSRDEAAELRRRALGLGLEGAFIADTRVRER